MTDKIENKGRAYRRGLVLGWTLAEIFLLIVFALLLLFGELERKQDRELNTKAELKGAQTQNHELQMANDKLKLQTQVLARALSIPNGFDDLFRELVVAESTVADLRRQIAALEEKSQVVHNLEAALGHDLQSRDSGRDQLDSLAKQAAEAAKANEILRASGLQKGGEHSLSDSVKLVSEDALLVREVAKKAGLNAGELRGLNAREQQAAHSLNDCRGSLANMQQRFAAIGLGTESPACWADPETGHPEYIFDIALTSTGLLVRDNSLKDRTEDEKQLPIRGIRFGPELTPDEFLTETLPVYEYGKNQKAPNEACRFFVRVFDETKPYEKDVYKRTLRTVGSRFYYFEVRDLSFASLKASASDNAP